MFGPSKELIDKAISRRAFIQRMTAAGISLVGARAMAASLTGEDDATPAQSRVLENHTGGELMAEFLIDWNVPYVFGLAGWPARRKSVFLTPSSIGRNSTTQRAFTNTSQWPWRTAIRVRPATHRSSACIR